MNLNEFLNLGIKHFNFNIVEELKSEKFIYTRYNSSFGEFIHLHAPVGLSYFNEFYFSELVLLPNFSEFEDTFSFMKELQKEQDATDWIKKMAS